MTHRNGCSLLIDAGELNLLPEYLFGLSDRLTVSNDVVDAELREVQRHNLT
jgi:hypothetical protein